MEWCRSMVVGAGGAYAVVGGRRVELGGGKPLDVLVASRLGLRYALPGPGPSWPYTYKPWECRRYAAGPGVVVDLFRPPPPGLAVRLERPGKAPPRASVASELAVSSQPSWGRLPRIQADVIVVGGGIAGLAAAREIVERGARVVLVDYSESPGGYLGLVWSPSELDESRSSAELVASIHGFLATREGFRGLPGYEYVASLGGRRHLLMGPEGPLIVEAGLVIYAHGGVDARPLFPGNWLPGIVSSEYALRLAALHGVSFRVAVVIGWGPWTLRVAGQLASRHADRVIIVTKRRLQAGVSYYDYASRYGVELIEDRIVRVRPDSGGLRLDFREYESVVADAVVSAIGPYPDIASLLHVGAKPLYSESQSMLAPQAGDDHSIAPGAFAAGLAAGYRSEYAAYHSGRLAGLAAAAKLGRADETEVKEAILDLTKDPGAADLVVERRQGGRPAPPPEPEALVSPGISSGVMLDACSLVDAEEFEAALRRHRRLEAAVEETGALRGSDGGRESLQTLVQLSSMVLGVSPAALPLERILPYTPQASLALGMARSLAVMGVRGSWLG